MALDLPENLSAYAPNKTRKGDIVTIGNEFDTIYSSLINNQSKGVRYHKSLDFSNVGMPTVASKAGTDGVKFLRQFHQTRLYIQDYGGILRHSEQDVATCETYLISANLPEQFSYKIGSKWSQPFGSFTSDKVNALLQLGGHQLINDMTSTNFGDNFQSTTARISTIMAWNGSEPLSLNLRIPVIDDGHPNESTTGSGLRTNLVEALEFLGSLCLPKGEKSALGFYQPPPSPYDFSFNSKTYSGNHARIMLQLGGMLLVDNVIIKGISVDYPNTKAMIRHWYKEPTTNAGASGSSYLTPLLASVNIDITTSEALTAQTYSKMLWLKTQTDQGSFKTSTTEAKKFAKDTAAAGKGILNNGINLISNLANGSTVNTQHSA
nr:MAG TPA: hypothetical protein [Caudoviricetes sp.]